MKKTMVLTFALLILSTGMAFAVEKDFTAPASNVMAYIASIAKNVDQNSVSFEQLAQQFIWNNAEKVSVKGDAKGPNRPFIYVGGYWDTQVSWSEGGYLRFIVYVTDPDGPQNTEIREVRVYFGGQPTELLLLDNGQSGDFAAGDGVYGFHMDVPPETLPAGQYLLEVVATDVDGNTSDMWPYLTIN